MARIRIARGSIVDLEVDAIVNAANSSLQGGGGVDGAIHRAAGPRLAESAARQAPCPPGEARITNGFDLKAKYVIHTVGPIYEGGADHAEETLARCYRSSLQLADERKIGSVAVPAISTGAFGYPFAAAAAVAVREIAAWLDEHAYPRMVVLSAYSNESATALEEALGDLGRPDLTEN
ncbi:MAG TPA: macro domain-containing protein [Candidatus Limnocylindrales bacterium]